MKLAMPVSLMELLAIPLSNLKTIAKWLVISPSFWMKQLAIRLSCQIPQPIRWLSRKRARGTKFDGTTDMTTSHLTKLQKSQQVIGYSHSTKTSKNAVQVAGYRYASFTIL
jgi:hypothetical protein